VVDDDHVIQVDLHDMAQADLDGAVVIPVVDELAACLPKRERPAVPGGLFVAHPRRPGSLAADSLTC